MYQVHNTHTHSQRRNSTFFFNFTFTLRRVRTRMNEKGGARKSAKSDETLPFFTKICLARTEDSARGRARARERERERERETWAKIHFWPDTGKRTCIRRMLIRCITQNVSRTVSVTLEHLHPTSPVKLRSLSQLVSRCFFYSVTQSLSPHVRTDVL